MDSGNQEIKAAGQERVLEDDRQDQQPSQEDVEEVERDGDEEELEFEDVPMGVRSAPEQEDGNLSDAPGSAFSDSSSDEEEADEEEDDADSDGSSEYGDLEVEASNGRVIVKRNGSNVYEGPSQANDYANEIPEHPESAIAGSNEDDQDDGAENSDQEVEEEVVEEEAQDSGIKASPGKPQFSPRTKRRIEYEYCRGFDYHQRPRDMYELKVVLQHDGRKVGFDEDDDPSYQPQNMGRGRSSHDIKDERDMLHTRRTTTGQPTPRRPSPLNPKRVALDEQVRAYKAAHPDQEPDDEWEEKHEEDEEEEGDGDWDQLGSLLEDTPETANAPTPVQTIESPDEGTENTEEAAGASEEAINTPEERSCEQQVAGDNAENTITATEAEPSTTASSQGAGPMSWDEIRKASSGGLNFDDDEEDDRLFREQLNEIQRRQSQDSERRASSAKSSEDSASKQDGQSNGEDPTKKDDESPRTPTFDDLNKSIWAKSPEPAAARPATATSPTHDHATTSTPPSPLSGPVQSNEAIPATDISVDEEASEAQQDGQTRRFGPSLPRPEYIGAMYDNDIIPPRPIVHMPQLIPAPRVNLPPARPSNGMAAAMEAGPPTPAGESFQVEDQETSNGRTPPDDDTTAVESPSVDLSTQTSPSRKSSVDASTQTEVPPESKPAPQAAAAQPKPKTKSHPPKKEDESAEPDYIALTDRFLSDARWHYKNSKRLRRERDEALGRLDEAYQRNRMFLQSIEKLKEEIDWWRGELQESDMRLNGAKRRFKQLEDELNSKCTDCVRDNRPAYLNPSSRKLGDIEDMFGDHVERVFDDKIVDDPEPKDDDSKPKNDVACKRCKGRWVKLEHELAKEATRAKDLEEEKKQFERKLEKVKEECRKKIEEWKNHGEAAGKKWQEYANKNEERAERDRQREEAELKRQPLPWNLDLDGTDRLMRFNNRLAYWINKQKRDESQGEDHVEVDPDFIETLLNNPNLTFQGFVEVLQVQGFLFRPDHLAQHIRDFYRAEEAVVPPAIRYAAEQMANDPVQAVRDLLDEVDTWNRRGATEASMTADLSETIQKQQERLDEVSETLADAREEVRTANERARSDLRQEHAAEIEECNERTEELTKELTELQEKLEDCENHRSSTKTDRETEQRKIEELQKEIENLKKENEKVKKELQEALKSIEDNLASDSEPDNDLEQQLTHCREHGEKLSKENEDLQLKLNELKVKIQDLETQITQREAKIKDFQDEFTNHQETFQRDLEERDARIRQLEEDLAAAQQNNNGPSGYENWNSFSFGTEAPSIDPKSPSPPPSPTPRSRGLSKKASSPVPQIQTPPARRPRTPAEPSPPVTTTPAPLPKAPTPLPKTPVLQTAKLHTSTSPAPGPATPRTPSTPGGFNLLLGERPAGWQARDARWRFSTTGRYVLGRTTERTIQKNAEDDAMEVLRRQAYQGLTGREEWPVVSREERERVYKRFAKMRFGGVEGAVNAKVEAAA